MLERHVDDDGIATLTLAHGKANALDAELCAALADAVESVASEARAIVLTGQGNCFCAGVDLLRIRDGEGAYVAEFLPELIRSFRVLFDCPLPVVAAVNGHAIAGGCVAVCAADLRLMADGKGRVGMAELAVGVPLPAGAIEIVRFAARADRLQQILYRATNWTAAQALELGLVDELCAPEALMEQAHTAARRLADVPEVSFRLTKDRLRAETRARLDDAASQAYDRAVMDGWQSEGVLAALDTFVRKTLSH